MFKSVGYSVKGSRSEENEDSYLILAHQGFYLVADGVGGGPCGREASKIVVREMLSACFDCVNKGAVLAAIDAANSKVRQFAERNGTKGAASTVAALWLNGANAVVFNVGDSRVYKIGTDGVMDQLSVDHSKVLENDAKSRNIITKAVGVKEKIEVETGVFSHAKGDIYVLVSDGISDVVTDLKIEEIVNSNGLSMLDKCSALVAEAETAGGKDDKTIILVAT